MCFLTIMGRTVLRCGAGSKPAGRDGRLKVGDCLLSVRQLSPDAWIAAHTGGPSQGAAAQTLESVLAVLQSEASGAWVCEVMRQGCGDVLEVEISSLVPEQQKDPFGAAAMQKNLWEQMIQATSPNKQAWQTKAARVCSARVKTPKLFAFAHSLGTISAAPVGNGKGAVSRWRADFTYMNATRITHCQ